METDWQNEKLISDEEIAAKISTAKRYILVILKNGPDRNQDSATLEKIQMDHLRYIFYLKKNYGLLIQGPVSDEYTEYRGIEIFDYADKEKIQQLLLQDPAIKSGRMTPEVYYWYGLPSDLQ
jgi:hypothetical protein